MSTVVNKVKDFFNVLKSYVNDATTDGVSILDSAVRTTSHFANLQDAINNFVSDTTNTSTYADVDERLENICGIQQNYLDSTIANELVNAGIFGSGSIATKIPQFLAEGVSKLFGGNDDSDSDQTKDIKALASDKELLTQAISLAIGTGSVFAYPAGYMFLRYLCQQSLNLGTQVGNSDSPVNFSYDGGENVISNYKSADKIIYSTDFTGWNLSGDDLILNSSSGKLYLRDARDKLVNVADAEGNIVAYEYMASGAGEIDGAGFDKFAVIIGADNASNNITAGNSGSSLWGGYGGTEDILTGGEGQDTFSYGYGNGNDTINNAESKDAVNLFSITLEQIVSAEITDSGVNLKFTDGGSLTVGGQAENFILGSQTYRADYQNKSWVDNQSE